MLNYDYSSTELFRFVLSTTPTEPSLTLLNDPSYNKYQIGERIEVSPESFQIAQQIAKRLADKGGSALLIDYGHDKMCSDSLRASFYICLLYIYIRKSINTN